MTIIDTRLTHDGHIRIARHDGIGVVVMNTITGEQFTAEAQYTLGRVVSQAERYEQLGRDAATAYWELKDDFID